MSCSERIDLPVHASGKPVPIWITVSQATLAFCSFDVCVLHTELASCPAETSYPNEIRNNSLCPRISIPYPPMTSICDGTEPSPDRDLSRVCNPIASWTGASTSVLLVRRRLPSQSDIGFVCHRFPNHGIAAAGISRYRVPENRRGIFWQ